MAQSRVQKGKGKKSKFPMWGLGIIVVLVVVIAGYAIVRFSEASVNIKRVNTGIQCGGKIVYKGAGYGNSCVLTGSQVARASWNKIGLGTSTRLCAVVVLTNDGEAQLKIKGTTTSGGPVTLSHGLYPFKQSRDIDGNLVNQGQLACYSLSPADKSVISLANLLVTLEVSSVRGNAGVISMYPAP